MSPNGYAPRVAVSKSEAARLTRRRDQPDWGLYAKDRQGGILDLVFCKLTICRQTGSGDSANRLPSLTLLQLVDGDLQSEVT